MQACRPKTLCAWHVQEHVYQPVNLQQHSWVGDAGYNPYLQQQQQQQQAPAMAQRATKRGPREGEVLSETQAAFYRQGVPSTMQWTGKKTPGWLMYDKKVRTAGWWRVLPHCCSTNFQSNSFDLARPAGEDASTMTCPWHPTAPKHAAIRVGRANYGRGTCTACV